MIHDWLRGVEAIHIHNQSALPRSHNLLRYFQLQILGFKNIKDYDYAFN